ncbi:hypothetical protein PSQ90_00755 [Devosia rhodophyticola]|uniref:Peptide ABC transporter permease n=1 Tax=Devosia rhodophyticola TaxID=3026423 RepID=A0ABY7YY55_9HYPH|nr:hypothetical protein [Devosia rhodophyticola]WDR06028.1 hypothetical protein PSQ90_00755 [Devosia rhodophyticola]
MAKYSNHQSGSKEADEIANRRLLVMLIAGMVLAVIGISVIFAVVH